MMFMIEPDRHNVWAMSSFVKIVITSPVKNADDVRAALAEAGAGQSGNYTHCSFSTPGKGRFMPVAGAHPHVGEVGRLEVVDEERIEVLCERNRARGALEAAIAVHPYEEPAYEVYPVLALDDL
jgi:hypothetical protein